ncbi:hypothetical protein FO519_004700 [Halicephalobus sp. NKZ332]|nr:hypothetical protein FO519_004700 [Halicephalobus sp. NKZ332]
MSFNITIEVLDGFSNRLHLNTVLNLVVNIPTIYFIVFHSSKAMGFYKYYLLYTVVTTLVMDLHQTFFYGIYFLLPSMVNYLIFNINISVVGFGLLSLAGYRYFSLNGSFNFFEKKITLFGLFFVGIVYPIPTVITLVLASFDQNEKEITNLVKNQSPEFLSLTKLGICSSFKTAPLGYLYMGISGLQIGLVEFLGFFFTLRTVSVLKSLKGSLSKTTYSVQKQFLISMSLQILIPIFTLLMPISLVMFLAILNVRNSSFFSEIAVHIMTLHAPLNGLVILLSIKPYRDALKKFTSFKFFNINVQIFAVTTSETTDR